MTTMTTTMTSTKTTAKLSTTAAGCAGGGCDARDPWPLYRVRLRGNLSSLCASCVLKHHPRSFCAACFLLVDAGSAPAAVSCSKCPSVSHIACLPGPTAAAEFVCASCECGRRMIDSGSAKVMLLASRIAANSMSRGAVVMRADAELKVKKAAAAKKRAREMVLSFLANWNGKENADSTLGLPPPPPEEVMKVTGGCVDQKRVQSREVEKWMRLHEPVPIETAQGNGERKKAKGGGLHVNSKSRVGSAGREERVKKGSGLSTQSGKEGEKSLVGGGGKGGQPTQDALVSRTNSRPIVTGSQSTTTNLHS